MTELRDARLRQALDQAPDAGVKPPARVSDAIRGAARAAVQPAWRRWWPAAGELRPSWMAAFASVLVASLVVLIWQGQEVPGARPEPRLADQPAPAAIPAPVPLPVSAPPQASVPAPAPVPVASAPAPRAPAVKPAQAPPARAAAQAHAARARDSAQRRETAGVTPAPAAIAPPAPRAEAPPAEALAKAAPLPPPPMAAPAPAAAAIDAPAAAARFAAPAPPPWTQVRISAGGRTVLVPRSQAEAMPALVARLLAAPREPAAPVPASLRLELEAQGVLEWSEEGGWRLLPQGDPQRAQLLRADDATAAALRVEAERLLAR